MRLLVRIRDSYGALRVLYWLSGLLNLFCRRFDHTANCKARAAARVPDGLLNGQALPPLAELPYGAWRIGRNGCEVIAAYNVMQALGHPLPFSAVAELLERRGLLFRGYGGTNLAALGAFFRHSGVTFRLLRCRDRREFDAAFAAADCAVLSYWTGKTLRRADGSWNTLHTVSVHHRAGGVAVCNADTTDRLPAEAASLTEFLTAEDGAPVCLYLLYKIG